MDWVRFLDENNIHYVTRGPNTKRGEISIQCPMCAEDDPSEHLGINLESGYWGCHRDASHRGKSARTLIKALLRCTSHAAQLVVRQYDHADPDDLDAALAALTLAALRGEGAADLVTEVKRQSLDPQFDDFSRIRPRGVTSRFFKYIQDRGYDDPQSLIDKYEIRCALTGRYKDRVILPVRMHGELLGWTSRAIGNVTNAPRYLASNETIKATVFNYDEAKKGGNVLFITEGPFDALKIDDRYNIASDWHVRAVCTFGTSVTLPQITLLRALAKKYDKAWVLFDKDAFAPATELSQWLGGNCSVSVALLPDKVKDPGELDSSELAELASQYFPGYFSVKWSHPYFDGAVDWKRHL